MDNKVYYTEGTIERCRKERRELIEYHKWIADKMNCKLEDLVMLDTQPQFQKDDKQGWILQFFFPKGIEYKAKLIKERLNLCWEGCRFTIPRIYEVVVNNVTYIADTYMSPYRVLAVKSENTINLKNM